MMLQKKNDTKQAFTNTNVKISRHYLQSLPSGHRRLKDVFRTS